MKTNAVVGCVLAVACVACVSKSKYQSAVEQLKQCRDANAVCVADLEKERTDRKTEAEDLRAKLDAASKDRDAANAGRSGAEKALADLRATTETELADLRKQRAEAEKRLQAFKSLTAKFQKMIDAGKIKVYVRGGRMIVKLPAGILFASGKADLSTEGKAAISEVATILAEFTDRQFMIAGHTDNVPVGGRYRDNWELSTARAVTVTEFLIKQGVSPKSLVAAGYGEFDPVGGNETDEGKQENRRIEIILLPNIDELPTIPDEAKNN